MKIRLKKKDRSINKVFNLMGDKSIAHRSLIIGTLGKGEYTIKNFPNNLDCLSTLTCMERLGVNAKIQKGDVIINSPGFENFNKNAGILDAGNSGTTARLLSGLLAGTKLMGTIDGDESLRKRPMDRIIVPLKQMGAEINTNNNLLPLSFIRSKKLIGIEYNMPIASAQVKSSLLIAGFLSEGKTTITEKQYTRDHTERMFKALGSNIEVNNLRISISNSKITVKDMIIPGDISSAAFVIGCALMHEDCNIKIENVLLNERRKKYLDILIKMNANIEYKVIKTENYEEIGYVIAKSSSLKGITIEEDEVPNIIDEIPILAVLSCFAEGSTIFNGISELKFKESNRIRAIVDNLIECGVEVNYTDNYMEITGNNEYLNKDIYINPFNDHRIAMAFTALGCKNYKSTIINNWECTHISFPDFISILSEFFNVQS
ncbi:3-phosphoshikimate 1-carboxyvinyltransferase [Candidatus Clostridium radicumherbarum]|uniref:3-phosphoshikimate 1-carboxyvinyltransferase n=1 Tax=Candidatus Clostridium radicumherbarum TaxID=3381662 RepID=A0ABW8TWC6_9CLOT